MQISWTSAIRLTPQRGGKIQSGITTETKMAKILHVQASDFSNGLVITVMSIGNYSATNGGAIQWRAIQTTQLLEIAIHDVGVDVAPRRMLEGSGEAPNNRKAEALPQPYGTLVGADHEIVLHRAKSALARSVQRMRAHRSRHAAAH